MSTVGYGDIYCTTALGRAFIVLFILIGLVSSGFLFRVVVIILLLNTLYLSVLELDHAQIGSIRRRLLTASSHTHATVAHHSSFGWFSVEPDRYHKCNRRCLAAIS